MLKILIVEDDVIQRNNLIKIVQDMQIETQVYHSDSKDSALQLLETQDIDLFLVDVKLNNSNGLDLAKEIRKISKYKLTWIVFLTTHIDFMLQAFKEIHCYDYILKPYKKSKIIDTLTTLLSKNISETVVEEKEYISFESQGVMIRIPVEEIYFIEVRLRTCMIYAETGIYTINRTSLKKVLEMISVDYIIKTHKSFAVNVNKVHKLEKISRGCWEMDFYGYDNKALLASTYKDDLNKVLNIF